MGKGAHSAAQIIAALKQVEAGGTRGCVPPGIWARKACRKARP